MLKLFLIATIFALTYAQLDGLISQLPTADKCNTFNTNGEVQRDECWAAGCGVCINNEVPTCTPRVMISVGIKTEVNTNTCNGTWEVAKIGDIIPRDIIEEYQRNRDIWLSSAERQAIMDAVMAKVADLKAKCGAADQKAACLDAFNAWLGEYATWTDQQILDKVKQLKDAFELKLRDLGAFNVTGNDRCQEMPQGTPAEKEAKYKCIYERQVHALDFFKTRIITLQNILDFQKLQVVVLVRLSKSQISIAIDNSQILDVLKPFRVAIIERLRDFVVLTIVVDKLKEKIVTALANRDKAIALLDNIKQRADELVQKKEREIKDALLEIKQKVDDFKKGVRDFIKSYAKNAVECKVNVDATDSKSTFSVTCSIDRLPGETLEQIKNRFREEVKSVIEAQTGVEVKVDLPSSTTDADVVPQTADPAAPVKRVLQQQTLETLYTEAVFGGNSAASIVISFAVLAISLLAMLF